MRGDPWLALRSLRIGCVKYLNARPLICAYDGEVIFEHPSALARMLARDELDAGLVPVFEALRDPRYLLVDGVAVACDGPVFSVFLAYRGELRDVHSVACDPASLTSSNLLKVLLAKFHGLHPSFGEQGDARLLIGNQAIEFRLANENVCDHWKFLDLGEEWKLRTGLPFVFALWALRPETPDATAVANALRRLKRCGTERILELVSHEDFADEKTRRRYLTEFLRYDIGPHGKTAIERFRDLLAADGRIERIERPLTFL